MAQTRSGELKGSPQVRHRFTPAGPGSYLGYRNWASKMVIKTFLDVLLQVNYNILGLMAKTMGLPQTGGACSDWPMD